MFSEMGKKPKNQIEHNSSNKGELQEGQDQEGTKAANASKSETKVTEVSTDIENNSKEEGKVLQPDIEAIKTQSLETLKQKNLEKAQAKVKEIDYPRELTEAEKKYLEDTLGWGEKQLKKCTINEKGVIVYKTDRRDLEGKVSENGVPYERKIIEINGVKIEGVFPRFNSVFDTYLDPIDYKSNTYADECNAKLKDEINNNPELRKQFTPEQLKDITEGRTPRGYVWHHNEEPGKMQLVKRIDHDRTIGGASHTGGNALWGPDSIDKPRKGEMF